MQTAPRPGRRGPAGGGARRQLRPGPPLSSPPAPGAALTFRAGGRGGGGGEGGGGERLLFLLFRALSPALLRSGPAWARPGTATPAGGRGQRVKPPPPPRTNKRRRLQPAPAPRPPPRALLPGRGAHFGRPPSRRGETSRLRYGAWFSRRLGERWRWRRRHWENGGRAPFPSPPFNLKRRENGASKRAGECRGHGEEGQQRLRRLRLQRAAPPRRAARGRPPRRPRGLPGGAAAAASVMAPRRGRCFCASVCGNRCLVPDTCGSDTRHCGKRRGALASIEVRLT